MFENLTKEFQCSNPSCREYPNISVYQEPGYCVFCGMQTIEIAPYMCSGGHPISREFLISVAQPAYDSYSKMSNIGPKKRIKYCPSCGADIRELVEKVRKEYRIPEEIKSNISFKDILKGIKG